MEGILGVFSAFFALLLVVPELSASFRALDDEEFFLIEGLLSISLCTFSRYLARVDRHMCQCFSKTTTIIIQSGEAPF